jgi:hypothetical protein
MLRSRATDAASHPGRVRSTLLLALALGSVSGSAAVLGQAPAWTGNPEAGVPDLRGILAPGYVLQDRNQDGHPDFVRARVVVPRDAGEAEVVAAANVSARLAFESYASDLDLVVREGDEERSGDTPLIVVGDARDALAPLGRPLPGVGAGLAPGEGALILLAGLPVGGVHVTGGDASGLLAVAEYFSARFPAVWEPEAASLAEVGNVLETHLEEGGLSGADLQLEQVVVSASRPGMLRLGATLEVREAGDVDRARALLAPELEEVRSLLPPGLHRLDIGITGPDGRRETRTLRPSTPWEDPEPEAWLPGPVSPFSLSRLYTLDGIYRDTREDLVPDRTVGWLSVHSGAAAEAVAGLAQRVALETAGVRLPLARVAGADDPPSDEGLPIAVGVDHPLTRRLLEAGRVGAAREGPGRGFVELVPGALDDGAALLVGATDGEGLAAAARVAARRIPYLHDPLRSERVGLPPRGDYPLEHVETEVRRFFQARSAAGQAALAVVKLEGWLDRLEGGEGPWIAPSDRPWPPVPSGAEVREGNDGPSGPEARDGPGRPDALPPDSLHLEVALDTVPPGLEDYLGSRIRTRMPGVPVGIELHPTGFGAGAEVFEKAFELEWEVDEVREILATEAYPRLEAAGGGRLEVRVSEPPEVRRALTGEIREELAARGLADSVEVRVLSAYKQGFGWMEEVILPRLQELGPEALGRVAIRYHHLRDSEEIPWQVVGSDTRWLQELFPIDAVLARELEIADSLVVFHAAAEADPMYRVRVEDAAGELVLEDSFSPWYVVEPYFHLYPDYERVRIATGGVRVETEEGVEVDRRVATDLERFWTQWQTRVLPRLRDYLMDLHRGAISPDHAPFFDELRIEVRLSEPNHRIGVDEEVISSLESLHNDLYFHTLAFLEHLGRHYGVGPLTFPGRVLPYIDPQGDGEGGSARVRLTGRTRAVPEVVLRATARREDPEGRWRYPLSPLPVQAPLLRGLGVRAGAEGLDLLLFQLAARDSTERFQELRGRASEAQIDRTMLPLPLLEGMVEALEALHGEGVLLGALSFDGVDALAFGIGLEDGKGDDPVRFLELARTERSSSTRHPVLQAGEGVREGERLVQWHSPIPPAESDSLLARLAVHPEVHAYLVGRSFLGREIYAADFLPPVELPYRSQARMNALRPTLLLSGRQHANEVSSTSHILRLGELLVTDPEYRELLRRVNVVLHPITNPDGAQLAWEMQKQNPDFTLHAGYLGALGVDMTAQAGEDDPVYPEAGVRPWLMGTWLPDIFLNLHGYPSHEWVQHFSGYAAWVRGRTVTARSWWAPRGWFVPGFNWVDDPDHPEIRIAQFAILDSMAAAIAAEPRVVEMSRRQYDRYARYGRQDVDGFREHFHEGMLIYLALRGRKVEGEGPANPRINTFSAVTEAPDETARGEWLELVARAGLAHTSAMARYLAGGEPRVERRARVLGSGVEREVFRVRPVLPPEALAEEEAGDPPPGEVGSR